MPDALSPAVFLDRDGTLMRDVDYCGDPKDVHVFPGAGAALRRLQEHGFMLIVITNQSAIGRGYFDEAAYRRVEAEVARQVGAGVIGATYFCPHPPDKGCACRKPKPGMILRAAKDHGIDLARSYIIGDKNSDLEAGRNAGVKTILVRTGYGGEVDATRSDYVAKDLTEAAQTILQGV